MEERAGEITEKGGFGVWGFLFVVSFVCFEGSSMQVCFLDYACNWSPKALPLWQELKVPS